jgi:hypothetical protein
MTEGGLVTSHTKYVSRLPPECPAPQKSPPKPVKTLKPGDATPVSLKLVSVAEGKKILKKGLREEKKKKEKSGPSRAGST